MPVTGAPKRSRSRSRALVTRTGHNQSRQGTAVMVEAAITQDCATKAMIIA